MTSALEDAQEISIDKWGTLNTAASPQKLPEGHSPNNQNVWMDEKPGSVITANGYRKLGTTPSGNPTTLLVNYYKTSDGSQVLILSDGQTVWSTTDYTNYTEIKTGLSSFFQLRGLVIRDKLWLTNGSDPVMTYDGSALTILDGTGGTPNVPVGKYIAYHDERVWIYGISGEPSSLRFSDLTDSSGTEITPDDANSWPVDNELKISEGDADIGTGLFLYRGYLYASKSYSIWRIVGYDEYTYTKVKTRSSTGTRFAESIREVDNLVNFIGVDGLYSFDGEQSTRISDIIDPANPEPGVFAFRNLQQPLLNNQFWNLSNTADWNTGTVPRNILTDNDRLTLSSDDTQTQFNAGTKTRVTADDNPGYLQLSKIASGGGSVNLSPGKTASLVASNSPPIIGTASQLVDGVLTGQKVGFLDGNDGNTKTWVIDLGANYSIGRVIIKSFYFDRSDSSLAYSSAGIDTSNDNSSWSNVSSISLPSSVRDASRRTIYDNTFVGGWFVDETDITSDFAMTSCRYVRVRIVGNKGVWAMSEMQVYLSAYEADGKFVSPSVDFGTAPESFGKLAATITSNGEAYQFFTQSSADGSTWDGEVAVSNGSAIGSTLRRYIRWGVYLYSSTGVNTPVIDKVFVGSSYTSIVFNTGGNIFQWGAFQLAANFSGQSVLAYYRASSTSGSVLALPWTAIANGAIPNTALTNQYIQIRIELSSGDATQVPYVTGTTVNWILGSGSGVNTLQNVASFVWLNRYWLSAATLGAMANDIVIVRGKSTFNSPYHKKDFSILSFCRFQDYFIAGSSTNGDIYRLETGYSKDGAAMDSFYETADFDKSGFLLKLLEIVVNTERSGPYNLNVGISIDGGISWTEKTIDLTRQSLTQNSSFVKKLIAGSIMSDKFRLRVRINAADQPFSVDGITVYHRLSLMRGSIN